MIICVVLEVGFGVLVDITLKIHLNQNFLDGGRGLCAEHF